MPELKLVLPDSIVAALDAEAARSGRSAAVLVRDAVAARLGHSLHTLFQVSTSGALVAGVTDREIDVATVLAHGDFGLGTFAGLDGEMVVLDGSAYQIQGSGRVAQAQPDTGVPFAVVCWSEPSAGTTVGPVGCMTELAAQCDGMRSSDNIFFALRLEGRFSHVRTRVVNPVASGTRLLQAAVAQSEFNFEDVEGTLIGIWSPGFSSAFSVPGYHFHFLSEDCQQGGHVLDVQATSLALRVQALNDFHLALPETEAFLKADLTGNGADELTYAEQAH